MMMRILLRPAALACGRKTGAVTKRGARVFHDVASLSGPMFVNQRALPRLPVPKLEETLEKYLWSVRPLLTETEYAETSRIVAQFGGDEGRYLQRKLVELDSAAPETSYISNMWYDYYLSGRDSIAIGSNPFLAFEPNPALAEDQCSRVTSFVSAIARFYVFVRERNLKPDTWNVFPLDMSQYPWLFMSTRIPLHGRDELKPFTNQKHIVVLHKGHIYSFDILNAEHKPISDADLQMQFATILRQGELDPNGPEIGLLTSADRETWAQVRSRMEAMPQNRASLETIDSALFVVSLDDHGAAQLDWTEHAHQMLHGNGRNRWFDKSFTLVVTSNGRAAVNFEHSWGDGICVLRMATDAWADSCNWVPPVQSTVTSNQRPKRLEWDINSELQTNIEFQRDVMKRRLDQLGLTVVELFKDQGLFGRSDVTAHRCSPDGLLQMAIQLAFYRISGTVTSVYESASTAAFLKGRTEVIRGTTPDSVFFVTEFDKLYQGESHEEQRLRRETSLRQAISTQGDVSFAAVCGKGIDRHLFALKHIAAQEQQIKPLPAIFLDVGYERLTHNTLSTSTLVAPGLELGGFGPVTDDGYGIGYGINDKGMRFIVTAIEKDHDKGKVECFASVLQQSVLDCFNVISQRYV